MKKIISLLILMFFILISCSVEPKVIKYGDDHCFHCDMTVVDKTHSAQYVTKKGKAYMFDAVECLTMKINKEYNERDLEFILVADYVTPGKLVDAKKATYLISEKIKSPMGANLSAFFDKKIADDYLEKHGGKLYTWNSLKQHFSK
jgi:copper chaperone NosL